MRTIKLFATLRDFVGAKEITVPFESGGTARDLIGAIRQVNPALGDKIADTDGQLSGLVHIFVEGRNIEWLQGLDTVIADTDEVFMIPPVAGG
jgi:MoaD family protein